jgi:hypothetical protein
VFLKAALSLTLLFNLIFVTSAHAYIDPNTGGFFFQTVAPFVYGLLGVIVVFWKRITGFFKGLFGKKEQNDSANSK